MELELELEMRGYLKVIEFKLRDHVIELPHVCTWPISDTE